MIKEKDALALVERLRNIHHAKSGTLSASYMREAADEITRLRSDLERARKALEQIDRQYENHDLSHKDFRIGAKVVTDAALAVLAH